MTVTAEGLFDGLFDDAALFPPGNAPMPDAVRAHATYRKSQVARYVGPFVCPANRLAEFAAQRPAGIAVSVVADELTPALAQYPGVRIVAVELRPGSAPAPLPDGVAGYLEFARHGDVAEWAKRLAGTGWRAKFRTGGTTADAFPGEDELASWIAAAVHAGLAFKCTAGLHNAVRHRDPVTGFEHHGFLNVLAATDAARRGTPAAEVADLLGARDVAARVAGIDPGVRGSFVSFGTCSVSEPLEDLRALGLVAT